MDKQTSSTRAPWELLERQHREAFPQTCLV